MPRVIILKILRFIKRTKARLAQIVQHSIESERRFHQRLVKFMYVALKNLEEKLRSFQYDYRGQRKNDENKERHLKIAEDEPYFGVIFLRETASSQIHQIRIGRGEIYGDFDSDGIRDGIVSWSAPVAARYYSETESDPNDPEYGKTEYKAQVVIENREVVRLIESRADRDARVRTEIQKAKTADLGDILETIRPDQDSLVRMRETLPVVIQGGPGTGKTVVGLQRLAYATTNADGTFKDESVLAIGPSNSYVNYVKNYLPGLGVSLFENQTINDLVLKSLSGEEKEKLRELRVETEEIVRVKNSPKLDEIIRKTIWPAVEMFQIEYQRLLSNNINPSALVPATDVEKILQPLFNQFHVGEIDYETAKLVFARALEAVMVSGQVSNGFGIGNKTNEQRIEGLLDSWLLKVGVRSQKRREDWLEILRRPAGRRIRREMGAILRSFYIRDIRDAIELLVNEQSENELTLEPSVLKRKLEALAVELKGDNMDNDFETETGVQTLRAKAIRDSDDLDIRGIRVSVVEVVNQILPDKTPMEVASFVVTGTSPAFQTQTDVVKTMARKLNDSAEFIDNSNDQYFWTDADVPIVGVVADAIKKTFSNFDHILVDEAQDLTRMQSKVVAQFLKGSSITLLGDINQATKPAALGNWRGLIQMLGISENFVLKTLEQNYRVPSDIFDYAVSYLPEPVDNGSIPSSELDGGQIDIPLDFLAENLEQTIRNVINSKDESERIAVIAEDRGVIDVSEFNPERIKVVTPEESKGLEFDHSIVVSPADWYDGSTSMARTMYVVLTRATKSITVLQRNIKRTSIKFLEN